MFWRSLQWRLVIIFITITLVLMLSISVVIYVSVQSKFYDVFKNSIERGFDELNDYILNRENEDGKNTLSLDELKYILDTEDGDNCAAVYFAITGQYKSYTIINPKNQKIEVSSDSREKEESFYNEILSSENYIEVLSGKETGNNNVTVEIGDRVYYDYSRLMHLSDGDYILYFRNDREEWQSVIGEFNNIILYGTAIAVFLAILLGYVFARMITVPIVNLMNEAKRIASGQFGKLLEVKSDDEIGKLTDTFNLMALELKSTLLEISGEKSKIETILNYMTDGVIAYNKVGDIIHKNPTATSMLGVENVNLTYNEFSKKFGFGITIDEIIYTQNIDTKVTTIKIKDRFFRLYYATIVNDDNHSEGLIAVIQDITEQQKLDNMRKEFVANVSHELKTPLTSIKSYSETLLEDDINDINLQKRFLGVINSEAERMARLVKDLLQLSSFDSSKMNLDMKILSIDDITKRSLEKLLINAKSKNQILIANLEESLPKIKADEDKIEQVILNILSNAIKYTPENGEIKVNVVKENNEVKMEFNDNGIGIPEEDTIRIFERFYRVDKARSREMGGTGLGLAIAKEIIELHGGRIAVTSKLNVGTSVIIYLPIKSSV
jgi:two-component system sensor histidine kinase VicK